MRPSRKLYQKVRLCQFTLALSALACVSCAPIDEEYSTSVRPPPVAVAERVSGGPRQLSSIEHYLEERVKQLSLDQGRQQSQPSEKSKARQLNSIEPLLEERAKQLLGLDNASQNSDSESSSLTPGGSASGSSGGGGGSMSSGNSEQSRGRHLYYGGGAAAAYGGTYSQPQKYSVAAALPYGAKPLAYAPERPENIPKIYEGNKLYLPPGSEASPAYPTSAGVAVAPLELPVVRPVLELTKPEIKIYSTSKSKHPGQQPKKATQKKIISFKEVVQREELLGADRVFQPEFYTQEEAYPVIVEHGQKKKKATTTTTGAPKRSSISGPKTSKPKTTKAPATTTTTTTTEAPEPPATESAPEAKPTARGVTRARPTKPVKASEPESEKAEEPTQEEEEEAPKKGEQQQEKPGKQEEVAPRKQVKQKPVREDQPEEPTKQEEEQPAPEEAPAERQEEQKPRKKAKSPEREEQEEEPAPRKQVEKKPDREEQPAQREQPEEEAQQPAREERAPEKEEQAQPQEVKESPRQEEEQQREKEPKRSLFDESGFGGIQALKDLFGGGQSEPDSSPQRAAKLADDGKEAAPSIESPNEQPGGGNESPAATGTERDQQEPQGASNRGDQGSEQPDEDPEHHDDVGQVMGRQAKPPPGLFGDHEEGNPVDELEERMDLLAAIMKNSKEDREALEEAKKVEARPQLLADSDENPDGAEQDQQQQQQQQVGGKSEMENQIDSLRDALSEAIERASKKKSPSSSEGSGDSVEVASQGNSPSQDQGLFGLDFSSLG